MRSFRLDWPGFWRSVASTPFTSLHSVWLESRTRVIWDHAQRTGMTLVTKDSDFAELSSRSVAGPTVVLVRIGNSTNRELKRRLGPVLIEIVDALAKGERLIECDSRTAC